MKYISALFTLLLAGSPCLADDFLYIECKTLTRAVFTEIKNKKLLVELLEYLGWLHFCREVAQRDLAGCGDIGEEPVSIRSR